MKQQLEQRLQSLKAEFEAGQKMLADLEAKQANLRETLLRISGAIQVIEEELSKASETDENSNQPVETISAEVVT
jgi:chromosome segregation ATPase